MASTTTVRIHPSTRDALTRLSEQRGVSTADLLAELVERREQDQMLEQMNIAYAQVRSDPTALKAEMAERAGWDKTLLDGLSKL